MTALAERIITTPETVGERIFGTNGVLARKKADYEPRQPQIEMADLVEQLLRDGGHALVEAGTGTGKSYAYLMPAIEHGKRVVVSTESIQLQEQLIRKDLPFLEAALGRPVKYAIAKGRGNYFCERNTLVQIQENRAKLIKTDYDTEVRLVAEGLISDFAGEWDGNKATLKRAVPDTLWSDFAGDDSCSGGKCPHALDCAYIQAKAKFEDADIIITNHHYYLLHHYVREQSGGVVCLLPEHQIWVADEAHTLADIAQGVYGLEIRQGAPKRFVTKLLRQLKALKLDLDIKWDVPAIEERADEFFGCFRGALKDEQLWDEFPEAILAEAREAMSRLVDAIEPIRIGLHRLKASLADDDPDTSRALRMLAMNANGLTDGLRQFFQPPTIYCPDCHGTAQDEESGHLCQACEGTGSIPDPDPPVQYVEVASRSRSYTSEKHVTLHRKPAETHRIFRGLYQHLRTAIFTSATLAAGGSFGPIADELGINAFDVETLQARSPFDYQNQVRGYFPRTVPDGKSPDYHDRLAEEVLRIAEWTGGRAFILFTSNRDMRAVQERIEFTCPYPVLMQGEMPKDLLIERFKAEPSVLLGVRAFWTGVDIPGQALSCVVLVKFPFPQPEAPLVKARCQKIEARRQRSFDVYSLPRAIRDIQQGFGRLIRSRTDRGLFVILDSRLHTAKYAQKVLRSLPAFPYSDQLPTDWSLDDGTGVHPTQRQATSEEPRSTAQRTHAALSGAAGPVRQSEPHVCAPAPSLDFEADARSADHPCNPAPAAAQDPAGDRAAAAGDAEPAGVLGRADLGSSARASADAAGPAGGDPGDTTARTSDRPARWRYLALYVDGYYCNRGPGTGVIGLGELPFADRNEARARWETLFTQYQRFSARTAWLYENEGDPMWDERSAATERSAAKFAQLRDELAAWCGVDDADVIELLGAALEYRLEEEA